MLNASHHPPNPRPEANRGPAHSAELPVQLNLHLVFILEHSSLASKKRVVVDPDSVGEYILQILHIVVE